MSVTNWTRPLLETSWGHPDVNFDTWPLSLKRQWSYCSCSVWFSSSSIDWRHFRLKSEIHCREHIFENTSNIESESTIDPDTLSCLRCCKLPNKWLLSGKTTGISSVVFSYVQQLGSWLLEDMCCESSSNLEQLASVLIICPLKMGGIVPKVSWFKLLLCVLIKLDSVVETILSHIMANC